MNLIDTNGVTYIFQSGIKCEEIYYMAPEITEEVEMTQDIFSRNLPRQIINIYSYEFFNESFYIDFYNLMLNKHHGRSFFNMTGFGDISILATIHTTSKVFSIQKTQCLFDPTETINIFTNDEGLKKRINTEFSNAGVQCKAIEDIR